MLKLIVCAHLLSETLGRACCETCCGLPVWDGVLRICNNAARPIAATMYVLCDRSRSGYAIVHGVCACAAPVRDRNHAEAASIGETVFKISPPFGTLALSTRTSNISWCSAYRKRGFWSRAQLHADVETCSPLIPSPARLRDGWPGARARGAC